MNKANHQNSETESLLTNIGESYEYLRVIAKNNIEIKKLEALKVFRFALSKIIVAALIGTLIFFICALLIILMTYSFFILLNSAPYAIMSSIAVLILLCLILYLLRNFLFAKTIENNIASLAKLKS